MIYATYDELTHLHNIGMHVMSFTADGCRFGIDANVPITYRASCNGQATLQECNLYTSSSSRAAGVVCRRNVVELESTYDSFI